MIIQTTTLDTEAKVKAIYGGTKWTKIEGSFLLGASSSYKINTTGGEATHTLTINEIPSHNHAFSNGGHSLNIGCNSGHLGLPKEAGFVMAQDNAFSNTTKNTCSISASGGGKAHNNMPPYKAVYIWERTA